MNKNQLIHPSPITITSLSHDGRGVGSINGKTTFVSGALSGEIVSFKLTKKHSRYNEGIAVNILQPAPDRTPPACEHFSTCGGCSLQHVSLNTQIQLKLKVLLEQLKHFGHITPEEILPPLTGKSLGYRRKARLGVHFMKNKNRLLIGFREKASNKITDIDRCPILDYSVGNHIGDLRELLTQLDEPHSIPQIEVAVSDNAATLIFRHLTPLSENDILKIKSFAEKFNFHIYLQPNKPNAISKLWPEKSSDQLEYVLTDYQLTLKFSPLDFVQINSEVNQMLIKQALTMLDLQSEDRVLDLFCGLGNFTLPISRFVKEAIGVEGSDEMVNRAKENADYNQITNASFFVANLMEPTTSSAWLKHKYNKILLDPPRAGAKEIIPFIINNDVEKIVYVSCNPATFARDAKELVYTYGYKLTRLCLANMFPHTSHIESVALFEK